MAAERATLGAQSSEWRGATAHHADRQADALVAGKRSDPRLLSIRSRSSVVGQVTAAMVTDEGRALLSDGRSLESPR